MTVDVTTAPSDYPRWMTPRTLSDAEKGEIALAWNGDSDPAFRVSLPRLRELIDSGFTATSLYYFRIGGPTIGQTAFNAWCRKLGKDLHRLIADQIDSGIASELEPFARDVGDVNNWTKGFISLFSYLDAVRRLTDIDVDGLTVVGRPGGPLLDKARGLSSTTDPSGELDGTKIRGTATRVYELLRQEKNVVVEGVAGSGKSHLLEFLRTQYSDVEVVVFHPSTSYEEFVSGLRPSPSGGFEGVSGVFARACDRAAANPDDHHLLFIDEINRANTSKVFGDLLLPLEKTKRADAHALGGQALTAEPPIPAISVRIQTPVGSDQLSHLAVPDNLHVIGTMNSTDRSVGTIDLALRRRFAWFPMEPLSAESLAEDPDFVSKIDRESPDVKTEWQGVVDWYGQTNETLSTEIGPDARLGHAYIFSASSPLAAAQGLVSQLAEIAFTFNLSPETLEEIPAVELRTESVSLSATYRGQGLGRRTSVVSQQLSAETTEAGGEM